jgi:hypothetical protein
LNTLKFLDPLERATVGTIEFTESRSSPEPFTEKPKLPLLLGANVRQP